MESIGNPFWKSFGKPIEILWGSFGNQCRYIGDDLESFENSLGIIGNPSETHWKSIGIPIEVLRKSEDNPLAIIWKSFGDPFAIVGDPLEID